MAASAYNYEFFNVTFPREYIAQVEINRAEKLNSFRDPMWANMRNLFAQLSVDPEVRVVVITGKGDKAFSAGLDVQAATDSGVGSPHMRGADTARTAFKIRQHILDYQSCVTAVEKCMKPVVAAMHGYCFGLAIDLTSACDIRVCSEDAKLCVKETELGLAADVGTLQRFPKCGVSLSWVKELCYTSRVFSPREALHMGYLSDVLPSKAKTLERALEIAEMIASKSPVAVQSTKNLMDYSRDHTVDEGLYYTAAWNQAALLTDDMTKSMLSGLQKGEKKKPTFEKL